MTAATVKKIRNIKPPYPFEAYSHIISQLQKEDGGGFLITFPDLSGCMSDGQTEAEAVANGKDAFKAWAKFGVHITENGVDRAGSAVHTATGNIGIVNQMILVDMAANMTLTLPTLASVPAGWLITVTLRSRTAGILSVDGNGAETVIGVATPTSSTVGYTLRIRKGTSTTDWEAATV